MPTILVLVFKICLTSNRNDLQMCSSDYCSFDYFFRQTYEGFINVTTIINDIDAIVTSSVALYGELSILKGDTISVLVKRFSRNYSERHSKRPRCPRQCWSRCWRSRLWYRKYFAGRFCPRYISLAPTAYNRRSYSFYSGLIVQAIHLIADQIADLIEAASDLFVRSCYTFPALVRIIAIIQSNQLEPNLLVWIDRIFIRN